MPTQAKAVAGRPILAQGAQPKLQPLLFVGDPHLSSHRIARRIDDYAQCVIDDLRQCVTLARSLGARMVILGDLFDRARESDIGLLSDLIVVLRSLDEPALVLVGNHDKTSEALMPDTTLALLGRAGVVELIDRPRSIDFNGLTLHGVPHGFAIGAHAAAPAGNLSVMITHHDLAIAPNLNPQAAPIAPIEGCHLLVNGHDHTTKDPVRCGDTWYFNPGNISRVSVAQLHHKPAVFALLPTAGSAPEDDLDLFNARPSDAVLELAVSEDKGEGEWVKANNGRAACSWRVQRFELAHAAGEHIFDLTGYNSTLNEMSTDDALDSYLGDLSQSSREKFIAALSSSSNLQAAGGGDVVENMVRRVMDDMNVHATVRSIVEERILFPA